MKASYHIQDNTLNRKMQAYIDSMEFAKRKVVHRQIKEIIDFFVDTF